MLQTIFLVFLSIQFLACVHPGGEQPAYSLSHEDFVLPFDMERPDHTYVLDPVLDEISGLTWGPGEILFAIHDEQDLVYQIDPRSGKIVERQRIKKRADYEGIANCGNHLLVVESNGDVHKLTLEDWKEDVFKTRLKKANDIEGITCLGESGEFIVVGKERIHRDSGAHLRAMYYFGWKDDQPLSVRQTIMDLPAASRELRASRIPGSSFAKSTVRRRLNVFGPSAVDIDPMTGLIYVLSARGKLLTVWNETGEARGIYFLKNSMYYQPEGLCFDDEGNLYISNEAGVRHANIHVFFRRRQAL